MRKIPLSQTVVPCFLNVFDFFRIFFNFQINELIPKVFGSALISQFELRFLCRPNVY